MQSDTRPMSLISGCGSCRRRPRAARHSAAVWVVPRGDHRDSGACSSNCWSAGIFSLRGMSDLPGKAGGAIRYQPTNASAVACRGFMQQLVSVAPTNGKRRCPHASDCWQPKQARVRRRGWIGTPYGADGDARRAVLYAPATNSSGRTSRCLIES